MYLGISFDRKKTTLGYRVLLLSVSVKMGLRLKQIVDLILQLQNKGINKI